MEAYTGTSFFVQPEGVWPADAEVHQPEAGMQKVSESGCESRERSFGATASYVLLMSGHSEMCKLCSLI